MLLRRIAATTLALVVMSASTVSAQPVARDGVIHRAVAREAARLARTAPQASFAQWPSGDEPDRSWIGRHPVLTGALIGATAGAIWANVMCRGACEGDSRPYMLLFGGIGAGIGAGAGGVATLIQR
jgi:hypothetical protein